MKVMNIKTLFSKLVTIPSSSGKEDHVRNYIKRFCSERGIELGQDAYGNLYFTNKGSKLLLTAHMDTVQGNTKIEPVVDKETFVSKGDTILGADDKANLSGILMVVDHYYINDLRPNFELLFTVEEELGMYGIKQVDLSKFHSKRALSFDKQGERFGSIVVSAPYGVNIEIEVIGKAAHSSLPEDAINALKIAGEIITRLPIGGKNNQTTFNLGLISGGTETNVIPEKILMRGDIRSHNKAELDKLITDIKRVLSSITKKHGAHYKLTVEKVIEGYHYDEKDEFISQIIVCLKEINIKHQFIKTSGGSDANILNRNKIKTVVVASGSLDAHTSNERISIGDLENITKLQLQLLKK